MKCIFSGLHGVDAGDEPEVSLGSGFSLVRTNDYLLSARSKIDLSGREWDEHGGVNWYLVYKHEMPQGIAPSALLDYLTIGHEDIKEIFSNGLIALQVLKPIGTLGTLFYGEFYERESPAPPGFSLQTIERRPPMNPWPWAWRRPFNKELIQRVPAAINSIQRIMQGQVAEKKNAFILLQLGLEHFHHLVAGLFWVMGLEAIFDSWGKEDFRKNLCACLGENTLVFPDWHPAQRPNLTVGDVAFDLYVLRSKLAHGADLREAASDPKYPVDLIERRVLPSSSEPVPYALLLSEVACYLLCQVLQKEIAADISLNG